MNLYNSIIKVVAKVKYPFFLLVFYVVFLVGNEGLESMNHSALMCSFYLEYKKYRFFGCNPLRMKGRKRSFLCFANRVHQKSIYFPQNTNTKKLEYK
jgi:hypothetical protein